MTPQDTQRIFQWARRQSAPLVIRLSRGPAGGAGDQLAHFCDVLQAMVPSLRVETDTEEPFRTPSLIIGKHHNIAFQAVPQGPELPPFLTALGWATAQPPTDLASDLAALLPRIQLPAELTLYIAMQCPHCPRAVGQLLAFAAAADRIRLAIVDSVLFAGSAYRHNIRSVPTLILDDHLRWSGAIDMAEVLRQCIQRDPARISAGSLRRMLESGDAPSVAAMMEDHGQVFPALLELLVHDRWPVRLGAMVTVEYLAEAAPALADQLIDPLWERFGTLPAAVQGDVVQVIGQVGGKKGARCLRAILAGDYETAVKTAAAEELADKRVISS